jgi:hypothetical protein
MGLADIKDQVLDNIKSKWGDFQETEIYNRAKEKFEDLPSTAQKAIVIGSIGLVCLIIVSIPWGWLSDASRSIELFEEDKSTLRELLKVSRDLEQAPEVPPTITSSALRTQVDDILSSMKFLPEQIVEVLEKDFPPSRGSKLVPASFISKGVQVTLKKLNLKQVVDVSHRFQSVGRGSKLMAMDMTANMEDNHFYDSTFHIIAYSLPSKPEPEKDDKKGRKRSRKRGNRK